MLQQSPFLSGNRKYLLVLLTCLSTGTIISVQSCTQKEPITINSAAVPKDSVYSEVKVLPEFPGGEEALYQYLGKIRYPEHEKELHIGGTVRARFVVTKTGKIRDIILQTHVSPAIDAEVKRIVSSMPDWKPGRNAAGEAVSVYYQIPVTFLDINKQPATFTAIGEPKEDVAPDSNTIVRFELEDM